MREAARGLLHPQCRSRVLLLKNLLCSFPVPQHSVAEPRVTLPAVPRVGRAKMRTEEPWQAGRRGGSAPLAAEEGPAAERRAARSPLPTSMGGQHGRARLPFRCYFRRKERGKNGRSLWTIWGRSQSCHGVTDTAERSRCGGQGSGAQYATPPRAAETITVGIMYFVIFLKNISETNRFICSSLLVAQRPNLLINRRGCLRRWQMVPC